MFKNFIDINDFNKNELEKILLFAKKIKKNPSKYDKILKNKSLGIFFEKPSLRTRVSFDIGMKKLGGNVLIINKDEIGFGTRESQSDIIKTLSLYIDCLLIRNSNHEKIKSISKLNFLPIINGLSNYSHPCQILSDIFTIQEYFGKLNNLKLAWIGDVNNVLISLIQAINIFNIKLNICVPKKLLLNKKLYLNELSSNNIIFFNNPEEALNKVDCVMTDVWKSMGDKNSVKKIKLFRNFQVNDSLMNFANKKAVFMHCLPVRRNKEVTDSVIDGKQSIVWKQAENRMYVQQSIMNYCINKK